MDYCYTLNLPSMTWTYHNLVAPVGTSGPRSHHSGKLSKIINVVAIVDVNNIHIFFNHLV